MNTNAIPGGIKFAVAALIAGGSALLLGCGNTSTTETSPTSGGIGGNGSTGKVQITLNDTTIATGDEVGFRVRLTDANGAPVSFVRMFCESERGIAIIEPSANGVAFESTDENGEFSGRLGGISPGSYLIECRAQQGFNVVDRTTLIVTGDVPQGFTGWSGAAGGNLGGGSVTDPNDTERVRITRAVYQQSGADTLSIDTDRNCNCAGASPVTAIDPEPFTGARVAITIQNETNGEYRVTSASVSGLATSGTLSFTDSTTVIPANSSGTLTLAVANASGRCTITGSAISSSPTLSPALNTGNVQTSIRVTGTTTTGAVSATASVVVGVGDFDNCDS